MVSWNAWKKSLVAAMFLGVVSTPSAFAVPVVTAVATPNPVQVGSVVGVDIMVSGVADLFGFQFSISFNDEILQATSVTEGAFLATGGSTFFDGGTVDNTAGMITLVFNTLIGAIPGVNGNGVLAHIDFATLGVGTSVLSLNDVSLVDSQIGDIAATVENGSLVVSAVPEPDTLALLGLGLAGIGFVARRRTQAA